MVSQIPPTLRYFAATEKEFECDPGEKTKVSDLRIDDLILFLNPSEGGWQVCTVMQVKVTQYAEWIWIELHTPDNEIVVRAINTNQALKKVNNATANKKTTTQKTSIKAS